MAEIIGLAFSPAALAHLEKLPLKIRSQVVKKAKALMNDPHPQGSKQLQGITSAAGEPIYRERSGDYRILYLVRQNPKEVVILDIGHRKEIYR